MSGFNHAEHPWKCGPKSKKRWVTIYGSNGGRICQVIPHDWYAREHDLNVSLIAAAPELLEALQMLFDKFGGRVDFPSDKIKSIIENAAGGAR